MTIDPEALKAGVLFVLIGFTVLALWRDWQITAVVSATAMVTYASLAYPA
ncbi:hypothetical protein [Methyloceanibacter caenitepidi]|uniref:Uncharacterized protein n=1 Tax=Methyloceanibacter caenitepidi TaxID=1384459 RepID=A0A0A8K1V9_9HYPH|nr:hypothetical protein [Methyloceanibacter caenitepidi]BAQ16938.1 hypothetical protein GL4_1482 [Methyloceanibacter caenitepidi]